MKFLQQIFLREVRAQIEDENRWTKGALARDSDGRPRDPTGESATCWCLAGAVIVAVDRAYVDDIIRLLDRCVPNGPWGLAAEHPYVRYNDHDDVTHADVLRLLDQAIEEVR